MLTMQDCCYANSKPAELHESKISKMSGCLSTSQRTFCYDSIEAGLVYYLDNLVGKKKFFYLSTRHAEDNPLCMVFCKELTHTHLLIRSPQVIYLNKTARLKFSQFVLMKGTEVMRVDNKAVAWLPWYRRWLLWPLGPSDILNRMGHHLADSKNEKEARTNGPKWRRAYLTDSEWVNAEWKCLSNMFKFGLCQYSSSLDNSLSMPEDEGYIKFCEWLGDTKRMSASDGKYRGGLSDGEEAIYSRLDGPFEIVFHASHLLRKSHENEQDLSEVKSNAFLGIFGS